MDTIIKVSEELRKSFYESGFNFLAVTMKSNRILYPDGMRISASDYAATLTQL